MSKIKFLYAIPIVLAVTSGVTLDFTGDDGGQISTNLEAYAKSSGGRSRGGSFRRSSPPSRSGSRNSGSRNSGSRSSGSDSYRNNDGRSYRNDDGGYYHPTPIYGGRRYYGYSWGFFWLYLLLFLAGIAGLILVIYLFQQFVNRPKSSVPKELANDIVTVSKLQVALLGNAKMVQSEISELIGNADLSSSEGLAEQLQEAALVLLRNSDSWSHVLASSQKVKGREKAEVVFQEFSVAERSKFSSETLSNVNGQIKEREAVSPEYDETADYIVVTLLVGTEDDKPLFAEVNTFGELESALQRIAATPPDYLLTFELLISPQEESDCLTYDELLTEYQDMKQLL
ncbi:MAG: DUF1517 domain-containing protein [Hormoscilla sp.]